MLILSSELLHTISSLFGFARSPSKATTNKQTYLRNNKTIPIISIAIWNNRGVAPIYSIYNFPRLIHILGEKRLKKWLNPILYLLLNICHFMERHILKIIFFLKIKMMSIQRIIVFIRIRIFDFCTNGH